MNFTFFEGLNTRFVDRTGDTQTIHDPTLMHKQGKQPLVAGMYLFCVAAAQLGKALSSIHHFNVALGKFMEVPQAVDFSVQEQDDRHYLVGGVGGEDILRKGGVRTYAESALPIVSVPEEGLEFFFEHDDELIERFSGLTTLPQHFAASFFALAQSSAALLEARTEMQEAREGELAMYEPLSALNKGMQKGRIATYSSLDVFFPSGIIPVGSELCYKVHVGKAEAGGNAYNTTVQCRDNEREVCMMQATLQLVGEKIIFSDRANAVVRSPLTQLFQM